VIGETPQPGEKPSTEGNPWSFSDPGPGWWRGETDRAPTDPPTGGSRHPRRRAAQHRAEDVPGGTGTLLPPEAAGPPRTGEAAEAHAAGLRDATEQLAETTPMERHHDQVDAHRYDPLRPPAGHRARRTAATVAADQPTTVAADQPTTVAADEPTTVTADLPAEVAADQPDAAPAKPSWAVETTSERKVLAGETAEKLDGETAEKLEQETAEKPAPEQLPEPDVMVLPEPSARNRPTVPIESPAPIERGPVRQTRRSRPTEPLPRATGDPETDARLERLENSPFWHPDAEQALEPLPEDRPAHAGVRRAPRRAAPKTPVAASASLIALGLLAAFFAWVSAEPFWLAMGHGDRGYATVSACTSSGVTQHCAGRFTAADGRYTIAQVTLLGVGPGHRVPGTVSPARMVSPDSPRAYLGNTSPLLQIRWLLGFILVLFCGYAIAGVTGARRLESRRARRGAVLASLAGPVLLLVGFLIGAY
jgi:hypothetical protein